MSRNVPSGLRQIMEHKRIETRDARAAVPLHEMRQRARDTRPPRNFFAALTKRDDNDTATNVIAEIKRKSPSAGWMRPEYVPGPADIASPADPFQPEIIAKAYEQAGARAISCLTDERFFAGHISFIERVKSATALPVLRKDFILDEYQIYEARCAGADAVLLIAECLRESELIDLMILAHELKMTVLLEFHDPENFFRIKPHIGFPDTTHTLLGINNRDLNTMRTDLAHTLRMTTFLDDTSRVVSESGIRTPEDLQRLKDAGVHIVLVGEHLMKQEHPGDALKDLLAPPHRDPAKRAAHD